MAVAFLDMDGTIVNGDTNQLFFDFLLDKKVIEPSFFVPYKKFVKDYYDGILKIEDYVHYALKPILNLTKEERDSLVTEAVNKRIMPRVNKGAIDAINFHNNRGDVVVIVTATVDYLIEKIANNLGIKYLIACPVGKDKDGKLIDEITDTVPYQAGKVLRIQKFLKEQNLNLKGSYAYGDSLNDVDMLNLVDHPIAVDATKQLIESPYFKNYQSVSFKNAK